MGRTGKIVFSAILGVALVAFGARTLSSYARLRKSLEAVQHRARIPLHACEIQGTRGALCGTYEVFENRATRAGRKIGLNIMVLPALAAHAAPDAVFWLHGGPGAAATPTAQYNDQSFLGPLRETRDLVFVDQRGTGHSNGLWCDLGTDPSDPQAFFGELFPVDRVRACREKLEKTADLKQYTTPIAMDDLDEVRAALGYDKIDLVAASYGTIAAQVYMRQHAEHLRAVFLLGVASLSIKQPLPFAAAAQHALELLYRDCEADAQCHGAFPDLQKEFNAVLGRFDKGPIEAELVNPSTKQLEKVSITRGSYVEHLRLMLYTTGTARFVPIIVHRAYLNDFAPFAAMAAGSYPLAAIARGMYMTVTCSEGVPFITEDEVRQTRATFVGEYRVRAHQQACKEWPRGDVPREYIDPVKSDVPVLLISGEADGSTPPWFGEGMLKTLPHAKQVVVPHYGHQINSLCVIGMLERFMEQGNTDNIDASCAAATQRPPFALQVPAPRR